VSRINRVCTRCVMDTTATDICFDADGVCNFCRDFLVKLGVVQHRPAEFLAQRERLITRIKVNGQGKEYDCIVGVSGGVDSSFVLRLAVMNGLRPIAVHLDNGWDSELAVHNIANLVRSVGVDLYTHVIDWTENRDLQLSFFRANVVDLELLMDNAMLSLNYSQAAKFGVKYILTGNNLATEGIRMPEGWYQYKFDARNIRKIHSRFGTVPIRTHPVMSTLRYVSYEFVRGIKRIPFLDYFTYNKMEALDLLQREVGYKPYPYKHYESVFTRFYQAYILPRKFGFDKRRVHLSALVAGGQMTRADALAMLGTSTYPDPKQQEQDRTYVIKKLGFTEESFEAYMRAPGVPHEYYGSEIRFNNALVKVYKFFRGT
jgi:N-acetyl sugar amidotransferase